MKKIIAIIIIIALSCSMLSAQATTGFVDVSSEQEVIDIIDEIMTYNMSKIMNGTQTTEPDAYELQLESRLEEVGGEVLEASEVQALFYGVDNTVLPRITVPETTENVRWYSTRETLTVSGTTYEVQHITATARTSNTNLACHDSDEIFTDKQETINNVRKLVSIYGGKIVGTVLSLVPVVSWLPYEFFGAEVTVASDANAIYTALTSAAFSFVKVQGQDDYYQVLSACSNYVKFSGNISVTGTRNGNPITVTQPFDETMYDENFVNTQNAVNMYRQNGVSRTFINRYEMKCIENPQDYKYTYVVTIPTFNSLGQAG